MKLSISHKIKMLKREKKNNFTRSENVASVIMEEVALTAVLQPTTRGRWRCSGFTLVELWCGRLCLWTSVVMVTVTVLDCPQLHSKIRLFVVSQTFNWFLINVRKVSSKPDVASSWLHVDFILCQHVSIEKDSTYLFQSLTNIKLCALNN